MPGKRFSFYPSVRSLLFRLEAERSHRVALGLLALGYRVPGAGALLRARYARRVPQLPIDALGLRFPNPVGLAAGFDKDGRYVRELAAFGFGWLELGTVTPRPQGGAGKPRLFRLPARQALINRMGFNSAGMAAFVANLGRRAKPCLTGINIGKNRDTPLERAVDDYVAALRAVYIHAAYVAVNVSSPNTPGLRELQEREHLGELLRALKTEQAALTRAHEFYVPLALKIGPDLDDEQIALVAEAILESGFDAVIATNTTLDRPGIEHDLTAAEAGGLSGRPLEPLATRTIALLHRRLHGRASIIGVGGIADADDAWEKMVAGADLVQVYTGLVYQGPGIVEGIVRGLAERVARSGHATIAAALAGARAEQASLEARAPRAADPGSRSVR